MRNQISIKQIDETTHNTTQIDETLYEMRNQISIKHTTLIDETLYEMRNQISIKQYNPN